MRHAGALGLTLEYTGTMEDMHSLPAGMYLVDSGAHLAAVALGEGWVDVGGGSEVRRFERGASIPAEALEDIIRPDAHQGGPIILEVYRVKRGTGHARECTAKLKA